MRNIPLILILTFLTAGTMAGCKPKMCPIDSCEAKKIHYHEGTKFRGVAWWKFWKPQNPDVGEGWKDPKEESDQNPYF